MRILIVSPFPPHPERGGGRIRLWHMVQHLSQRHSLTLACFQRAAEEGPPALDALSQICRAISLVELDPDPDLTDPCLPREVQRYKSTDMDAELLRLRRERFDLVILEHIFMAQFRRLFPDTPIAIHEHNIESDVMARLARLTELGGVGLREPETLAAQTYADAGVEARRLRVYEDALWPTFALRITVSDADRDELMRRCPVGPTIAVPNGADVDSLPMGPLTGEARLLFMGTLDYYPNVDALHFFLEQVLPRLGDVEFIIAGRNPSRAICALADRRGVEVIAFPESMSRLAARSRVAILPLRCGGGTRLRIPYAFALGLPVVSTSLGCVGYDITPGRQVMIADDAPSFARAVRQLIEDDRLADRLRRAARQFVEDRYRWGTMLASLESALFIAADVGP
jgi:glycosyltransferase involved in cell wall biosynthesis